MKSRAEKGTGYGGGGDKVVWLEKRRNVDGGSEEDEERFPEKGRRVDSEYRLSAVTVSSH